MAWPFCRKFWGGAVRIAALPVKYEGEQDVRYRVVEQGYGKGSDRPQLCANLQAIVVSFLDNCFQSMPFLSAFGRSKYQVVFNTTSTLQTCNASLALTCTSGVYLGSSLHEH